MTGAVRQRGLDAILPLGRSGSARRPALEFALVHGRATIDWAVQEAVQAGATRLVLAAPSDYAPAEAILAHVRAWLAAQAPRAGLPGAEAILLRCTISGAEGWDALVRAAASHCRGAAALLIDPAMPLFGGGQVVTAAAFILRRVAQDGDPRAPRLALARLPWQAALRLPVLSGPVWRLAFRFDRAGPGDLLTVFAGRALLSLPLPDPEDCAASPWPAAYRFPFETLVRLLLAQGGQGVRLPFAPADENTCPALHLPGANGLTVRVFRSGGGPLP